MTKTLLKTSNATILKQKPIQSIDLSDVEKHPIAAGQTFELHSYKPERDHVRVAFANEFFNGFNTWYVYAPHVEIVQDGKAVLPKPRPKSIRLPIPYKSQRDNAENPEGSCNVTSLAMSWSIWVLNAALDGDSLKMNFSFAVCAFQMEISGFISSQDADHKNVEYRGIGEMEGW
jgi:hypothetical protein